MIDPNKELLLVLNFKTALLESVDWNESLSASLLTYLQNVIKENKTQPNQILEHIENEYGTAAHNLVKKFFLEVYIENGLYTKSEDNYEH